MEQPEAGDGAPQQRHKKSSAAKKAKKGGATGSGSGAASLQEGDGARGGVGRPGWVSAQSAQEVFLNNSAEQKINPRK